MSDLGQGLRRIGATIACRFISRMIRGYQKGTIHPTRHSYSCWTLAALAADLGGTLAGLNVPPGFRTTTIESKTNIFRACEPGQLTGVAVPVHVGRRMIVLQISIYRPDGKRAAMMIQTQMVLPRESATPLG